MAKAKTFDCKFNGLAAKKYGYGLGFRLNRGDITPDEADAMLTGAKLTAVLTCDPQGQGDSRGQETLVDTTVTLNVEAECRGFSCLTDHLSAQLSIHRDGVKVNELDQFSFHDGQITIKRTGDAKPADDGNRGDSAE